MFFVQIRNVTGRDGIYSCVARTENNDTEVWKDIVLNVAIPALPLTPRFTLQVLSSQFTVELIRSNFIYSGSACLSAFDYSRVRTFFNLKYLFRINGLLVPFFPLRIIAFQCCADAQISEKCMKVCSIDPEIEEDCSEYASGNSL